MIPALILIIAVLLCALVVLLVACTRKDRADADRCSPSCVMPDEGKRKYERKPRPCCGQLAAVRADGEFHDRRHVCVVTGENATTVTVVTPFDPKEAA